MSPICAMAAFVLMTQIGEWSPMAAYFFGALAIGALAGHIARITPGKAQ